MTKQDSNDKLEKQLSNLEPMPLRPEFRDRLSGIAQSNDRADSLSASSSTAPVWGLSQVLVTLVLVLLFGVFLTLAQRSGDVDRDSALLEGETDIVSQQPLESRPLDLFDRATREPTVLNMRASISNRANLAELLDRQSSRLLPAFSDSNITHVMK